MLQAAAGIAGKHEVNLPEGGLFAKRKAR